MAIYDVYGNVISNAFEIGGNTIDKLYDINGNVIRDTESSSDLVVMSYNVQRFGGMNSNVNLVDSIFKKYNPDIIGFQEYYTTSTMDGVNLPSFLGRYWDYLEIGDTKIDNYTKAVASNLKLLNPTTVYYAVYSESRSYQKIYVSVGGKRIALFHTHLDSDYQGSPTTPKVKQITELFEAVKNEEYFIAFGDFNTVCKSTADADYINMIKQFVDAGYHCANCSDQFGFFNTWTGGTYSSTSWEQTDNVITSSNIDITEVIIDSTKLDAKTNQTIDHLPLVAYLSVN